MQSFWPPISGAAPEGVFLAAPAGAPLLRRALSTYHQIKMQLPFAESLTRDSWLFAAPAAVFLFYLFAWLRIGPEPKPGTTVVAYDPPDNLTAAAVRFVAYGTTDGRSFAAVIAQLARHGCLRVEPVDGKYRLARLMSDRASEATLAPEELRVLRLLFSDGPEIVLSPSLDERNTAQNGLYVNAIHEELNKRLAGKYMTRHGGVIAVGVLATFVLAFLMGAAAHGKELIETLFTTMWVMFVGLVIGLMLEISLARAWRSAVRATMDWKALIPGTAAIAIFAGAVSFLLYVLAHDVSPAYSLMLVALLATNLGWGPFLKRRTESGRKTCDQIAGFKMFLEKVEQDRLNRMNSSGEIPTDLDKYLPYAIALEVKEAWGDHLAEALIAATVMVEG